MKCTELQQYLDDYLDGALEPARHQALQFHIDQCLECGHVLVQENALRAALKDMPLASPDPGFVQQVFDRAAQQHQRRRWQGLLGAALAASFALWLGFGLFPESVLPPQQSLATVNMTLHELRTVNLTLNSDKALQGVTLSLSLPEGVELEGFEGQRQLVWQTDLQQGTNLLSLPLVATALQQGKLVARLEHGNKSKELAVLLQVGDPGTSGAIEQPARQLQALI